MSLLEQASALISSPNVSTVDGGVHGHRAFVFLSPYIPMVADMSDDAIYVLAACACACIKIYLRAAQTLGNEWKNHFCGMKGDVGMSCMDLDVKMFLCSFLCVFVSKTKM